MPPFLLMHKQDRIIPREEVDKYFTEIPDDLFQGASMNRLGSRYDGAKHLIIKRVD